jgi:SAM-dependent methyltransferase
LSLFRRIFDRSGAVGRSAYASRLEQELETYANCIDVNALPDIFHYWSDTYVRPMLEETGASNPDEFFARFLCRSATVCSQEVPHFISVGAGNCDTEVRVAKLMREHGLDRFVIHCLDINRTMLDRGMALAAECGVADHVRPMMGDFNTWKPGRRYSGIMANQSLHHVLELEHLFDSVKAALEEGALFVLSDIVGRNGHARWPEALAAVQTFWQELPDQYRYNWPLKRHEQTYENWDCSSEGFEGIRAQDILPALLARFHAHIFVSFGNVIDVFVDRNFGHNFDADASWDREFIDRVHACDETGLSSGALTPTHLLAVFASEACDSPFHSRGLLPAKCIRRSQASN